MTDLVATDLQLERAYLTALLARGDAAEHLRSPDRLEPFEMASANHRAILAAIHRVGAGGDVEPYAVVTDLEAASQPAAADVERLLAAGHIELGTLRPVVERLRGLRRARDVHEQLLRATAAVEQGRTDDAIEMALAATESRAQTSVGIDSAHDTAASALSQLCERANRDVIRAGFPIVDHATGGMPRRTMMCIGGTTGSGKSSISLAVAINCARRGQRVGIVSTEDADTVWGPRVLSHLVDIDSSGFYDETITRDFIELANRGLEEAKRIGVEFAWALNRPLADVLSAIRSLVVDKRCELVIVDYIQAIRLAGSDRRLAIGDAVQAIKSECQGLGVPLILTSQLKRAPSDKPFREPNASDLKEAGELENSAEVVLLLWKKGDGENAPTFGKVAKVKWSPRRPRFEVERNPRTGAIVGLSRMQEEPPAMSAPVNGTRRWGSPNA